MRTGEPGKELQLYTKQCWITNQHILSNNTITIQETTIIILVMVWQLYVNNKVNSWIIIIVNQYHPSIHTHLKYKLRLSQQVPHIHRLLTQQEQLLIVIHYCIRMVIIKDMHHQLNIHIIPYHIIMMWIG